MGFLLDGAVEGVTAVMKTAQRDHILGVVRTTDTEENKFKRKKAYHNHRMSGLERRSQTESACAARLLCIMGIPEVQRHL